MTDKEQEEAFLLSFREHPEDELNHLAYADWLEERGRDSEAQHHRWWSWEWETAYGWLKSFFDKYPDMDFESTVRELELVGQAPENLDYSVGWEERDLSTFAMMFRIYIRDPGWHAISNDPEEVFPYRCPTC